MRHRTVFRPALALVALTAVLPLVSTAAPVEAIAISPFVVGYHTQINGGIVFAQNSSLTCSNTRDTGATDATGCAAARTGSGSNTNNNNWIMTNVDVDTDASTFNSSSSELVLPAGTTVKYAALYWGARRKGANSQPSVNVPFDRVQLAVPGGAYTTIVADSMIAPTAAQYSDLPYQGRAVVTDLVKASGAGTYTVANVAAALGSDRYAGWTLAVVYEDPRKPLRDITLFEGLTVIQKSSPTDTITINGFTAPVAGPVDATVGLVAYDGDRASTGDTAAMNGVPLASAISPANNYFNSTVDTFGTAVTTRNPAYLNNLGYDVKVADATSIIRNSATSAQVSIGTSGETVYVGLISTRIDLTAPRFPSVKSVVNLNNNDPAKVGDTLEYTLDLTNIGDDPADAVVISDLIPSGTSYVAGSLQIDGATVTDGAGDDTGEFLTGPDRIVARLGTGANAATGGRIGIGASAVVTFQALVQASATGTTVINSASLSYVAATLRDTITAATNATRTPVQADDLTVDPVGAPELVVEKIAPDRLPAGSAVTYEVLVRNDGTAAATDVVLTDPSPAGVSLTAADAPCAISGGTVTCALGTLAPGDRVELTISGTVSTGLGGESALTNTATVTSSNAASATGSGTTTVSGAPDLTIVKSVIGALRAGAVGTYRFTVGNTGNGDATNVVVTDTLPSGVTPVTGGPCTLDVETPSLLLCPIGRVAQGATVTLDVQLSLAASLSGTVVNGALVTSDALDRDPNDNVSTVSSAVATQQLPASGGTTTLGWWAAGCTLLGATLLGLRRLRRTA